MYMCAWVLTLLSTEMQPKVLSVWKDGPLKNTENKVPRSKTPLTNPISQASPGVQCFNLLPPVNGD